MHAGTIAVLEEPVDEPLESYGSGGFATLDVRETLDGFDDATIQRGRASDTIETETEEIIINGSTIDVETTGSVEEVWTPWVADVTDTGFVVAERTNGTDPGFPFDVFRSRTGQKVERVEIDVADIIRSFRDRDRDVDVWMVGSDDGAAEMRYHHHAHVADAKRANIGVGFELAWNNTVAEGVMYASGYVAIYNDSWGPRKFAAFVRDVVLPHAEVPEDDEETEQAELDDETEDDADADTGDPAECDECGSVPTKTDLQEDAGDMVCIVCLDQREEEREQAVADGGQDDV